MLGERGKRLHTGNGKGGCRRRSCEESRRCSEGTAEAVVIYRTLPQGEGKGKADLASVSDTRRVPTVSLRVLNTGASRMARAALSSPSRPRRSSTKAMA